MKAPIAASIALCLGTSVFAQDQSDLAKQTQNPISSLISLPFQNNFLFNEAGDVTWNLNVQPVIPVTLNDDWNLITRAIVPTFAVENQVPGADSFGLGDINLTTFLSPSNSGAITWGLGPTVTFPTATDDIFGTEKWSGGLSAVALTSSGPWVVGGLVSNQWSFAGKGDRDNVNSFLLQPFVNYNFDGGWYATASPVITANWNAKSGERWTVPIGGGLGRVFNVGSQPVNAQLQGFYNVDHPSGGTEWSIRAQIQLLFPK